MIRTLSFVLAGGLAAVTAVAAEPGPPTFELRTYTTLPGKLEALNARFRDHTNALFAKHGMKIIGFWVPSDKDRGADNTLVYLLEFPAAPPFCSPPRRRS
jgi:hypothetical protein